jgi:plasmid stabilization system protein ParE
VKWAVIIRPRAETDLREACQWYEAQRPGLGDEFLDELKRAIIFLTEQPDRRPLYYRDFRRLLTRRFPYKLFSRIESDRVIVFRILHAKRDHPRWL